MRRITCAAVLALAVTGLWAEVGSDALSGAVEIDAPAWSPLVAAPGAPITVISAETIAQRGARSLADALELGLGALVVRNGGGSGLAQPSIRASSANQVLVIVDGQRINDSRAGAQDLALIPAESIERIEVLGAGASALYGADALGGAIVVTTKRAQDNRLALSASATVYPEAVALRGEGELLESQRLAVDGGLVLGSASVACAAQAERAAGEYPYGDGVLRENAGYEKATGRLAVELPLSGGKFSAALSGGIGDAGVAGSASWPTPHAAQGDAYLRGCLGFSHDGLIGGLLALETQIQGAFTRLVYKDPDVPVNDRHDYRSGGFDLRASYLAGSALELSAGLTALYEAANSTAFAANAEGQPSRLSLGAYLAPKLGTGERFILAPTLRFDWAEDYPAGLSFMTSLRYAATQALELRLSGGSAYRAPTFNDLYWPYTDYGHGYSACGNPDLKPERAVSGDAGFALSMGVFSVEASAFARYVDDLIVWSSAAATRPENLETAFIPGAAATTRLTLAHTALEASYEFVWPLDLSGGAVVAHAPRIESYAVHKANASVTYRAGVIDTDLSFRYQSERKRGTSVLAPATLVGAGVGISPRRGMRVGLRADNLFDVDYESTAGYPMPGRSFTASLKLEL